MNKKTDNLLHGLLRLVRARLGALQENAVWISWIICRVKVRLTFTTRFMYEFAFNT